MAKLDLEFSTYLKEFCPDVSPGQASMLTWCGIVNWWAWNSSVIRQKGKSRILQDVTKSRMLQENKARQIFYKINISYPLIHTRACAYQGVRNNRFLGNLACFVFLVTSISRFAFLPYCRQINVGTLGRREQARIKCIEL